MHRYDALLRFLLLACLLSHAAMAHAEGTVIGDQRLQLSVQSEGDSLAESDFRVDGQPLENVSAIPWLARIDGVEVKPPGKGVRIATERGKLPREMKLQGEMETLAWTLQYQVISPGCVTKTLTLTPKKDMVLEQVTLWAGRSTAAPVISRTGLQDIAAFYRQEKFGLFASLDFPYSRIVSEKSEKEETRVLYPPHERLKAGVPYVAHSLTLGATRLTGRQRYGFDEGEVAAVDAYVQGRFKPRFERPMFASCSINNRYTQPINGVIFYTWKDHPTLGRNTELLKRELALMPKLGIEYYQVFPGVFDWVPDDPKPEMVKDLMDYARAQGVRMGDYSGTTAVFCAHYNDHNNSLGHPEWIIQTATDGSRGVGYCFGNAAFADYYINTVVPNAKKYGFEMHCLDFLNIQPCFDATHGHPAGADSVYQEVKGLLRVIEAINNVSPQMMTWSNSGNWAEFLPKIAWTNPNLYLTDPFIATPWQGLNMTRLLDDARREQMVSLHYSRFIPYRYLTNCQYFFSQNSIVPDLRNYQYGALSTLAVTPNLCLGEVRPWIDRQTPEAQAEIAAFYKKWTAFIAKNFDLWRTTYHAGDNPGMGGVEIYSHARGDRGFIFIVNPQYWDATVEIPLDARLGLDGQGECELAELYPVERLRLTAQGPTVRLGTTLPFKVAAQQVLVLEVRPAPKRLKGPTLYGLPGTVEKTAGGYRIKTRGEQGRTERFAVLLPDERQAITSATVLADVPFQPPRQNYKTGLKLLASQPASALFELTFRREMAPTELRRWLVRQGGLEEGLAGKYVEGLPAVVAKDAKRTTDSAHTTGTASAEFPLFVNVSDKAVPLPLSDADATSLGLGNLANFCGAYVENALSEPQETWIELTMGGEAKSMTKPNGGKLVSDDAPPAIQALPDLARAPGKGWWLEANFELPFMYTIGAEPAFDEHVFLVLPLLRHQQARGVRAWVNGAELDIRPYRYPRNRALATYYSDLVGSGARGGNNRLVIYLEY